MAAASDLRIGRNRPTGQAAMVLTRLSAPQRMKSTPSKGRLEQDSNHDLFYCGAMRNSESTGGTTALSCGRGSCGIHS